MSSAERLTDGLFRKNRSKSKMLVNLDLKDDGQYCKGERKLMNDSVKAVCCQKSKADKEYRSKKGWNNLTVLLYSAERKKRNKVTR